MRSLSFFNAVGVTHEGRTKACCSSGHSAVNRECTVLVPTLIKLGLVTTGWCRSRQRRKVYVSGWPTQRDAVQPLAFETPERVSQSCSAATNEPHSLPPAPRLKHGPVVAVISRR